MKLQNIHKRRQLETITTIYAEITNYLAEHHSKELTKNLLRLLEQECKLIEARDKGKFDRKAEWFKETGLLKKQFKKPKNLSHERSKEYKSEREKKFMERTT